MTADERQAANALLLPLDLPAGADDALLGRRDLALLGFVMFYDARLSQDGGVRCASCHDPASAFGDGRPRAQGLGALERNSPSLYNAAWLPTQFWDGRGADLGLQAIGPLETPLEMGLSRLQLAHTVASLYAEPYAAIFGPLPALGDLQRFPAQGGPGDASFAAMADADRDAVNQLAQRTSQALAAYVRQVATGRGPLDDYLLGNDAALDAPAQRGLTVFLRASCSACHSGPNLSDGAYHNLGLPSWPGAPLDRGRGAITPSLAASQGAFRTPSLRNVGVIAPYGHNGIWPNLEAALDLHLAGGGRPGVGSVDPLLHPRRLSPAQRSDLLAFLRSLRGRYRGDPSLPPDWWNWPDR